mmetsp:Transcript_70107/g.111273  ORF Transcript_70107/g.111273 Transcript_70107/m.111273 type:complete len:229 (-) Transcript_70107:1159-1845(-)
MLMNSADLNLRKVLYHILECHPEYAHVLVHFDTGSVDHSKLKLQFECPFARILAPIALPCTRRLLTPRITDLQESNHLSTNLHFSSVKYAIGVRCLQTFLFHQVLLRLLASFLGATHTHYIASFAGRKDLGPRHRFVLIVAILIIILRHVFALKKKLCAFFDALLALFFAALPLGSPNVKTSDSLSGKASEQRHGLCDSAAHHVCPATVQLGGSLLHNRHPNLPPGAV